MTKSNDAMTFYVLLASWGTYGIVRFALSFVGLSVPDQVALAALAALAIVAGTLMNTIHEATNRILNA